MHRREKSMFPCVKVLWFLIPIALFFGCSNPADEAERRNGAMSRTIVASSPTIAPQESTIQTAAVASTTVSVGVEGSVVVTATRAEVGDACDEDFLGLDSSVGDAITRVRDFRYEALYSFLLEETATPEEFNIWRLDADRETAQVWRDTATNKGPVPARLLGEIAAIWEQSAGIGADRAAAQARNLPSLADAYSNLADEFEKCESTKWFAGVLREEAEGVR